MFEFFHQTDFADRRAGCAIFGGDLDFFERDEFVGLFVYAFVDLVRRLVVLGDWEEEDEEEGVLLRRFLRRAGVVSCWQWW